MRAIARKLSRLTAIAALGAACLSFGAHEAAADTVYSGYICWTTSSPNSSSGTFGDFGFVSASIYSGAECTGTYQATPYYCTTGATTAVCELSYLHGEVSIAHLADRLQYAAHNNLRVQANLTTGSTNKGKSITFYSD
jgi:hypothetical protein